MAIRRLSAALLTASLAFALTACEKQSPTSPTPSCTFTVTGGPAGEVAATASEFTVTVAAGAGCAWTASSSAAFVTTVGAASGSGNGSVRFAVQANTGAARQGSILVAGRTLTVSQAAGSAEICTFTVSPTEAAVARQGADVSVDVTIASGTDCAWTAASNDAFIAVKEGASGTGAGRVVLGVAENTGAARVGTATVAGRTISVLQEAATPPPVPCAFTVSPNPINVPPTGGSTAITITRTQGDTCPWAVSSLPSFVTVVGPSTGVNSGSVQISIASNPGPSARTGTMTVAGQSITINQSAPTGPPAAPVAVLNVLSDPGDFIGQGATASYMLDSTQFTATINAARSELRFQMLPIGQWTLNLAAPAGQQLTPGTYDRTARFGFHLSTQPGLDFSGMGRGCNKSTGRFLVTEAAYGATGSVDRFHARFEQHCEGWSVALRGEIWIDVQGAPLPAITPFPAPGAPTTFFSFVSDAGDWIGKGQTRSFAIPGSKFRAWASESRPAAVDISLQSPTNPGSNWTLSFQGTAGSGFLQPGTYTNATRYPFNAPGVPGLSVSGEGAGCSMLTGSFVVLEASHGPQGEVLRFRATFEQHCEGAVPALRGEIYIVANPWR